MVPENVRILIVWHVAHHNMPCPEAARLFGCDPSSVYRCKATHLATGELWPNGERRNTHRDNILYDDAFKSGRIAIIEERPELFLREINDIMGALQQLPAWPGHLASSTSTIDRVLRAVGWTHKRVITHYKNRNDNLRVRWARLMSLFPSSTFVSCDESHVEGSSTYRGSSRAHRGQRSHRLLASSENRQRFTVTESISSTGGVVAECITEHADGGSGQTEYDWLMFILIVLPNTNAAFGPAAATHNQKVNSILLIDNAQIHTSRVDAFTRAHGRRVVRLPPYGRDFAPVEMFFSKMKAELAEITTPLGLEQEGPFALDMACLSVYSQDCKGVLCSLSRAYDGCPARTQGGGRSAGRHARRCSSAHEPMVTACFLLNPNQAVLRRMNRTGSTLEPSLTK